MQDALYPLRFEPIFKHALWGGRSLRPLFGQPEPAEPEGEAWVLSDQGENCSRITNGRLAGKTLRQVMDANPRGLLGNAKPSNGCFPLLLKFLDARQPLSVQVHPDDDQAKRMEPTSAGLGKTEAWVILQKDPGSLLYAGLKKGVGSPQFGAALKSGTLPEVMHAYEPEQGDCIFLEAGTIHAIGAGLLLFEVQQTSDITYRLYDWGRVDAKSGKPRQLHIEQSLMCTNLERGPCDPVKPLPAPGAFREQLVNCRYFGLDRHRGSAPFQVGAIGCCRIVVAIQGNACVHYQGEDYRLKMGDVLLLPASVGVVDCTPNGLATLLEIALP